MSGVAGVRRTLAAVAAGLALGVVGAGCATSNSALSQANYVPSDGVQADSGLVGVRNLLIVSDGSGGTVTGAFYNNGTAADSVVSISAGGRDATIAPGSAGTVTSAPAAVGATAAPASAAPAAAAGPGTPTPLLASTSVIFGLPADRSGPQAYLTGQFPPGGLVAVRVVFATARELDLQVPVLPRAGYLATVPTGPANGAPAAAATASPTHAA